MILMQSCYVCDVMFLLVSVQIFVRKLSDLREFDQQCEPRGRPALGDQGREGDQHWVTRDNES